MEVDWSTTYFHLNDVNDDEDKSTTSLQASRWKAHKIHTLIEELSTREQLKKSNRSPDQPTTVCICRK